MRNQNDYEKNALTINIWTSCDYKPLPGANVGHVSLATANSYISLWPAPRENNIPSSELTKTERHIRHLSQYVSRRPSNFIASLEDDVILEAMSEGQFTEIGKFEYLPDDHWAVLVDDKTGNISRIQTKEQSLSDEAKQSVLLAVKPCQPAIRLTLYSLKAPLVQGKFNEIKDSLEHWRLIGNNRLAQVIGVSSTESCASLANRLLQAGDFTRLLSQKDKSLFHSKTSSIVKPDDLVTFIIKAKIKELENHPDTNTLHLDGESELVGDEGLCSLFGFKYPKINEPSNSGMRFQGMFSKT